LQFWLLPQRNFLPFLLRRLYLLYLSLKLPLLCNRQLPQWNFLCSLFDCCLKLSHLWWHQLLGVCCRLYSSQQYLQFLFITSAWLSDLRRLFLCPLFEIVLSFFWQLPFLCLPLSHLLQLHAMSELSSRLLPQYHRRLLALSLSIMLLTYSLSVLCSWIIPWYRKLLHLLGCPLTLPQLSVKHRLHRLCSSLLPQRQQLLSL